MERVRVTERFSDRAQDYVAARPGYPPGLLENLRAVAALPPAAVVADVGSGTGISSEVFLDAGCRVLAVEPNEAMRRAAEARLGAREGYTSLPGTAEATGLAPGSVDLVAAGQAFHWFDAEAAGREFARILKPGGWITLFWNTRDHEASPFMAELEALIRRFGTDYEQVHHRNVGAERVGQVLRRDVHRFQLPNEQRLDRQGLHARLLSASYLPPRDTPEAAAMLAEADELFDRHAQENQVVLHHRVDQHVGRP